jgi:hypothetical protein
LIGFIPLGFYILSAARTIILALYFNKVVVRKVLLTGFTSIIMEGEAIITVEPIVKKTTSGIVMIFLTVHTEGIMLVHAMFTHRYGMSVSIASDSHLIQRIFLTVLTERTAIVAILVPVDIVNIIFVETSVAPSASNTVVAAIVTVYGIVLINRRRALNAVYGVPDQDIFVLADNSVVQERYVGLVFRIIVIFVMQGVSVGSDPITHTNLVLFQRPEVGETKAVRDGLLDDIPIGISRFFVVGVGIQPGL